MQKLHDDKQHEHAVRLIEAALIHGQSQPWMYEVLAVSMRLAGRPQADIERVSLSMADFGKADYDSMLQSARYLAGFDVPAASMRMLRQAASMAPEREAAYLVALSVAEMLDDAEDIVWAASGVLATSHDPRAAAIRTRARALAAAAIARQDAAGETATAETLRRELADAEAIDLKIELTWSGEADLDLEVTEPRGDVCTFRSPVTPGGGNLLGDGFGPGNSEETYLAPRAFPGEYEVRVRPVAGQPTGGRARLSVSIRQEDGTMQTQKQTLAIGDDPVGFAFTLANGRRENPREVEVLQARPIGQRPAPPRAERVAGPVGAVGIAPQIDLLSEGAAMSGTAVVSPDRRYVRIGVTPWFNSITDVFTFSAVNGGGGGAAGGGGGQP